jgi:formylglycine-generating enzyme required for sulfatase activity
MPRAAVPHDVFLSHSSHDKLVADSACHFLERSGLRCWIAPRDVLPGTEWADAIHAGIRACRVFALIFSANANTSPHVLREVDQAIKAGLPILPFRIDATIPSPGLDFYIATSHWLDAVTPPLEAHFSRLERAVRALLESDGAGRSAPPPPGIGAPPRGGRTRARYLWLGVALALAAGVALALVPKSPGNGPVAPAPLPVPLRHWAEAAGPAIDATTGYPLRIRRLKDGAEMVMVPAGTFVMGAVADDPDAEEREKPSHSVTLSRAYYLDVHEVTNGRFEQFVNEENYKTSAEFDGDGFTLTGMAIKPWAQFPKVTWRSPFLGSSRSAAWQREPVVMVSWLDAQAYAMWARGGPRNGLGLPTEAQFERAMRGGTAGARYEWRTNAPPAGLVANYAGEELVRAFRFPKAVVQGYDDQYPLVAPVGSFPVEPYGTYDLAGNVSEWCEDWSSAYARDAQTDPSGPELGSERIVRGATWASLDLRVVRASIRQSKEQDFRASFIGFRLAWTLP